MAEDITIDESYDTTSGLLDEFDGEVQRAWFATDARYNDGKSIMLHLEIKTTDPDVPEVTEKFPVGTGWDSTDGGATIVHEKGKTQFNSSSIYGKILDLVKKDGGILHDVLPVLKSRGPSTNAAIWVGLTFHFKKTEFNYGAEIGAKSRVIPVKFLGEGAQPSLPTTAATAPAATEVAAPAASAVEADPVVLAKLRSAAKDSPTHQAFLDAAIAVDGVLTNDALMAALVDETATGFYATAIA